MSRWRKRPVVVEAERWVLGKDIPGLRVHNIAEPPNPPQYVGIIDTLEGQMKCYPGDFIITGVKGEKYACRADIFLETYEAEEDWSDPAAETGADIFDVEYHLGGEPFDKKP